MAVAYPECDQVTRRLEMTAKRTKGFSKLEQFLLVSSDMWWEYYITLAYYDYCFQFICLMPADCQVQVHRPSLIESVEQSPVHAKCFFFGSW